MHPILQFVLVVCTLLTTVVLYQVWVRFIIRKKLSVFYSYLLAAFGGGITVGVIFFIFSFLDAKSFEWSLQNRMVIVGKTFIYTFLGGFIALYLASQYRKALNKQSNHSEADESKERVNHS